MAAFNTEPTKLQPLYSRGPLHQQFHEYLWNKYITQAVAGGGGSGGSEQFVLYPWAKGSIGYSTKVHFSPKWDPPLEILATGM